MEEKNSEDQLVAIEQKDGSQRGAGNGKTKDRTGARGEDGDGGQVLRHSKFRLQIQQLPPFTSFHPSATDTKSRMQTGLNPKPQTPNPKQLPNVNFE